MLMIQVDDTWGVKKLILVQSLGFLSEQPVSPYQPSTKHMPKREVSERRDLTWQSILGWADTIHCS